MRSIYATGLRVGGWGVGEGGIYIIYLICTLVEFMYLGRCALPWVIQVSVVAFL